MEMNLEQGSISFKETSRRDREDKREKGLLDAIILDEEPKSISFKLKVPLLTTRYHLDFTRIHSIEISER